ncbi:unnamed protein product [Urochloa decumbens]|uniref:KIB1-4 beta-propeller domain-containing protein n=1 Tax=Urochloa decumbens TaxID=240449 RepID=A0ABC8VXY2_9POAL
MTTTLAVVTSPALASSFPPWRDLPPDLLGHVIAHLPFPGDRAPPPRRVPRMARRRAGAHTSPAAPPMGCPAGRLLLHRWRRWRLLPRIPSLPDDATCLGGAGAGGWLALDRTDAPRRRTSLLDKIRGDTLEPSGNVRHRHAYLLHNPFISGAAELDAIAGDVVEAFEIRKVLMRSGIPDDVVAITTNCRACSVIVLRPGKGASVLRYLPVFDVAFVGDRLYGITHDEDLIAFDLAEDGNGKLVFAKIKRVIRQPLADGEEDLWSYLDDDDEEQGEDEDEDEDDEEEQEFIDEWPNQIEDSFNTYGKVSDGTVNVEDTEGEKADDEPKDHIITTRYLLRSSNGEELLMARHHVQSTPFSGAYTREFELFRADLDSGKWVPVAHGGLAGEALFLSRSFSTSTSAYGGIDEGCVYFAASVHDVFDTGSWTGRAFSLPWQRKLFSSGFMTWLFPPELEL